MSEIGENQERTPRDVTSTFISECIDSAKFVGVGVPVFVAVGLTTATVLQALGVNLDIKEILTIAAAESPLVGVLTRALLYRNRTQ